MHLRQATDCLFRQASILALALALSVGGAQAAALRKDAPLPGDVVPGPAVRNQDVPQIARGNNSSLVVWTDLRSSLVFTGMNGPYTGAGLGSMTDIYAARLDANGNVIDTTPIVVSQAGYNQYAPVVSWNGQNWLVVWATERATDRYQHDIMAARVSPQGQVLDDPPLVLSAAATTDLIMPWAVSSDGSNWAVAWQGLDQAAGIFTIDGGRVSATGSVLDPGGRRLRRDSFNSYPTRARLAFAADEYLMTWTESDLSVSGNVVRGQRFSPALVALGSPFTINQYSPSVPRNPSVTTNGTDFFVVWSENWASGFAQLVGSRVSHFGAVQDPAGILLVDNGGSSSFTPSAAWDGSNYHVAYNKTALEDDLYLTRVNPSGTVLDPNGILIQGGAGNQNVPSLTAGVSGGVQVVYSDSSAPGATPLDIRGANVNSAGAVTLQGVVSQGAPNQEGVRLAAGNQGFLSVYLSRTSLGASVLAQRLDANGREVDATPFLLASGGGTLASPDVAWNGTEYLVVWDDTAQNAGRGQVYAKRVLSSGAVLDSTPLAILPGLQPAVAALADTFLVAAADAPTNPQLRYIYGARVSNAGVVLDAPFLVGANFAVVPAITALGNRWLVAWEQHPTHDDARATIAGAFVDVNGAPATQFFISDGGFDRAPSLASSGGSALLAWSERDIFARRIQADGTLLESNAGIVLSNAPNDQFTPRVAWDGAQYLVDWVDQRNYPLPGQPSDDIYATRVDVNGNVLDLAGILVAASPRPEAFPAVAARNGIALFGYAGFYNEAPYGSYRTTLRRYPFNQDYSINATPAFASIAPGSSATFSFEVTPVNNFSGTVTFSLLGLPPGAQATITPASLVGGGTVMATITTSSTAPLDLYPITVVAASGPQQSLATIFLNLTNSAAAPRYNVIDLGTFGGVASEAWGLNDAGDVVGWANNASGQKHAFRYRGGTMLDLGTLGGTESIAYGINSSGVVAGSSKNAANVQRAFRWSGSIADLGTIDGSPSQAFARGINNAGQIVGDATYYDGSTEAFIWNNGVMSGLGRISSTSYAFGINTAGEAVGWGQLSNGAARALRFANGSVQAFGVIAASSFDGSYGFGMNDAGQIVGASTYGSTTDTHAALFSSGGVLDLGTLGGTQSRAWGINGSAQIIGYSTNAGAARRAFLYENGAMTNLNNYISPGSGWVLQEARAINTSGQIAGVGTINGQTHAFFLTAPTPPQPIAPLRAVSRKFHGSAGTFDVNLPLSGAPGIEPRSGGSYNNHQIVVTFAQSVSLSGVQLVSGGTTNTASVSSYSVNGADVIVNLNGVASGQTVTVSLRGVTNGSSTNDVTIPIALLTGDSTGDRFVNAADTLQVRSRSGAPVDATTFRSDLNANGLLNSGDVLVARNNSGASLP